MYPSIYVPIGPARQKWLTTNRYIMSFPENTGRNARQFSSSTGRNALHSVLSSTGRNARLFCYSHGCWVENCVQNWVSNLNAQVDYDVFARMTLTAKVEQAKTKLNLIFVCIYYMCYIHAPADFQKDIKQKENHCIYNFTVIILGSLGFLGKI